MDSLSKLWNDLYEYIGFLYEIKPEMGRHVKELISHSLANYFVEVAMGIWHGKQMIVGAKKYLNGDRGLASAA